MFVADESNNAGNKELVEWQWKSNAGIRNEKKAKAEENVGSVAPRRG